MKALIRKVLKSRKVTAYRLAQETGISRQVISHWSTKGADSIRFDHLIKLQRGSGLSWQEIGELIESEHKHLIS